MRHILSKEEQNPITEILEAKEISVERLEEDNTCQIRISSGTSTQTINLEAQELSDFIGLMLHIQSLMRRIKKY